MQIDSREAKISRNILEKYRGVVRFPQMRTQ